MRYLVRVRRLLGALWLRPFQKNKCRKNRWFPWISQGVLGRLFFWNYLRLTLVLAFLSVAMAASAAVAPAGEDCGGAVENGCFQAADDCQGRIVGWTTAGNLSSFIVDDEVRVRDLTQEPLPVYYHCSGDMFVRIGVPVPPVWQPASWAALYQDVTVPGGADGKPEVRFRYRIVTHDIKDWSAFSVQVRRPDDSMEVLEKVLEDGFEPTTGPVGEKNNDLGWRVGVGDLSGFTGETVRLWFQSEHKWDKAVGIWTYLDDVVVFDNRYQIRMPIIASDFTAAAGSAPPLQGAEPSPPDATIPRPPTPTPTGG